MSDPKVRVRMYRQGLGDSFLITFGEGAAARHMLIDCGVFKGTSDESARMKSVAENIRDTTKQNGKGLIHLLVATHEHYDHVIGFRLARELFQPGQMRIERVWLPWTDDPHDPLARQMDKEQALMLSALHAAAGALADNSAWEESERGALAETAAGIREVMNFAGAAAEGEFGFAKTVDEAMDYVAGRAEVEREFLNPEKQPNPRTLPGLHGVRFYVLGPPHDPKKIARMNPAKSRPETYDLAQPSAEHLAFAAAAAMLLKDAEKRDPAARERFDRSLPFDAVHSRAADHPGVAALLEATYHLAGQEWRRIESDWLTSAATLALQLDSKTNNSSLALAIELVDSGRVLLFAADAQVGNWLSWHDYTWQVPGPGGQVRNVNAESLLRRTVLYKVGHHGSHNATLRDLGLELMTSSDLAAMIPVDEAFARDVQGWEMPAENLYKNLQQKTRGRILRSDRHWPASGVARPASLSKSEWTRFKQRAKLDPGGLFIDYVL
jgi:hypothetical protein